MLEMSEMCYIIDWGFHIIAMGLIKIRGGNSSISNSPIYLSVHVQIGIPISSRIWTRTVLHTRAGLSTGSCLSYRCRTL